MSTALFSSLHVQPCTDPNTVRSRRRRRPHRGGAPRAWSRRSSGSPRPGKDRHPLATALQGLGIQCYSQASVDAYKSAVVAASVRRFEDASRRINFHTKVDALCCARDLVQNGVVVLVALAVVATIVSKLLGSLFPALEVAISTGGLWALSFGLLFGVTGAFVAFYRYRSPASRALWLAKLQRLADDNARWRWAPVPLEQFDGMIPDEIRQRAGLILEVAPAGTSLTVDRVVVEAVPNAQTISDEARALANDPFLVVKFGDETFVVGVWDEAGFELP